LCGLKFYGHVAVLWNMVVLLDFAVGLVIDIFSYTVRLVWWIQLESDGIG
jgi:hypothetical protein